MKKKKVTKNIYELLNDAGIPILDPNTGIKYLKGKPLLHGGKRNGAGRKRIYTEETQTISFRVPKSLIEPITKYVKRALAKSKK